MSGGTRIRTGDTMIFRSVRILRFAAIESHGPNLSGLWRSPTVVSRY